MAGAMRRCEGRQGVGRAWPCGLVVQYPLGRVVEIVELAGARGVEEQPREDPPEDQRYGQQDEDGRHAAALRTAASTRDAPQMTTPLESGMSTAAMSGFTRPTIAAPTASTLYPSENR